MGSPKLGVTPRMWAIKQLSLTFAAGLPIAITSLAVVTLKPASPPKAMLLSPVLFCKAKRPMAVLLPPVVLLRSA